MIYGLESDLYLVSPVNLPPSALAAHMVVGAQLILVRSDVEFFDNDEIYAYLNRMSEMGASKPAQKVLLLASPFLLDSKFLEVARYWIYRGGIVLYRSENTDIYLLLTQIEKELKKVTEKSKTIWTDGNDEPIQKMDVIKDWRRTIATFPGIGEKIVEGIASDFDGIPLWYIMHLISRENNSVTTDSIRDKAREWLGLEKGEELVVARRNDDSKTN